MRELAVVEEQDIVYRVGSGTGAATAGAATRRRGDGNGRPDPVLLFRYSALTYNGHRIHYDAAYAREVEGYAGLVVHGPLLATLLLDLVRRQRPDATVQAFSFRAVAPMLADRPFAACGAPPDQAAKLWVAGGDGALTMTAEAVLAD